ncbi:hypothetical protein NEF87_000008 [Candidatus Lokiarchaeum ossiferum]|uniref:Steroid 5-alpha reductase C-terminal domain-containing protein n=1 Tax=Candidatus Lokiarchaeum ossiferum TaxID=2951803 RepID=A0ABY6HJP1_9ARCH|nr:hypothetical protein NEF87_000008 [Candidatus Lokiarchaeum sp. B-35]
MIEQKILSKTQESPKRTQSFLICGIAYLFGLCGGIFVGILLDDLHILLSTFIANVVATLIVYGFSMIYKNASLYDPYWSVQPFIIAIIWVILSPIRSLLIRQVLTIIVITLWSFRLTINWIRGWQGLQHEDWRYVNFREKNPKLFWFTNLMGIQLMPTILVYVGCISIYPVFFGTTQNNFGFLDVLGIIFCIGATLIEFFADEQLKIFQKTKKKGDIMNLHLWKYSRHPNYFGEISFWWGLFFIALAVDLQFWWLIIGPALITLLFIFISIPMMEKRQLSNKPAYLDYITQTSMLIPWFPKNK